MRAKIIDKMQISGPRVQAKSASTVVGLPHHKVAGRAPEGPFPQMLPRKNNAGSHAAIHGAQDDITADHKQQPADCVER